MVELPQNKQLLSVITTMIFNASKLTALLALPVLAVATPWGATTSATPPVTTTVTVSHLSVDHWVRVYSSITIGDSDKHCYTSLTVQHWITTVLQLTHNGWQFCG